MQFNLDQPVKFQGRFIASDLEIRKDHKVAVRAKLTKIEEIDQTHDVDLVPPDEYEPIESSWQERFSIQC
jgi:hypothetical protein